MNDVTTTQRTFQESQLCHARIEADKLRRQRRKETLIVVAIIAGAVLLAAWR